MVQPSPAHAPSFFVALSVKSYYGATDKQTMTTPQPTNNNDAYYDPSTNQIWYAKSSGAEGVVGKVIEGHQHVVAALKGKRIRGEIVEIADVPVQDIGVQNDRVSLK